VFSFILSYKNIINNSFDQLNNYRSKYISNDQFLKRMDNLFIIYVVLLLYHKMFPLSMNGQTPLITNL
jgi:hypothetical protein